MDLAALRGASSLSELHIQGAYLAGLQALAGLTQLKVSRAWGGTAAVTWHKAPASLSVLSCLTWHTAADGAKGLLPRRH